MLGWASPGAGAASLLPAVPQLVLNTTVNGPCGPGNIVACLTPRKRFGPEVEL